jgi:prepilin-type N-terminal cleavage/methylation domain-containing protein
MRKAFTLIELLVVIAIIAILAAILFPVFAQAKAAAKKIAGVSNAKQLDLSIIMYQNDVDDFVPPATAWSNGYSSYPLCFGTACFADWSYLCAPYIKNANIFFDPQVAPTPVFKFGTNQDAVIDATTWPDFGYNYVYMSPWNGTSQTPISSSQADQPANMISLAARGSTPEEQYQAPTVWGFAFSFTPHAPLLSDTVEVPNCDPIPQYCASNWGIGDFSCAALTVAAGMNSGGVSVRAGNQSIVSFLDGHTKAYNISALAVGTNWSPTLNQSNLTWTSAYPSQYLWTSNHNWTVVGSY